MRKRYALTAVPALLGALAVPGTALAADPGTGSGDTASRTQAALAADGRVRAWEHANGGGRHCWWTGHDASWTDCSPGGTMLNIASDLRNTGYVGGRDEVNFYWGQGYTGAWACLSVGDSWRNLDDGYIFSWGSDKDGYRERINDNIASHRWVVNCGDPS
ncbi:peptidase inhibitor family I36 protein [Actinoplanes sp. RD1]|uniref:peptidase inhibitor family I36 protein n=1 Tax=Actinoplanes sp. RD1 TaxID=3064538 RepID=UPI002741BE00|nr:peptidase inhibitor family I36 protein [Actinoplanes sp. RD1]